MSENPFQPPRSEVAQAPDASPRPPLVTLACRLLWGEFALGIASLHPAIRGEWWAQPDADPAAQPVVAGVMVLFALLFTGLGAYLLWQTGQRRNWARWTLFAYLAAGWLMVIPELENTLARTPLAGMFDTLCIANEFFVCYILILSRGAHWFRPVRAA